MSKEKQKTFKMLLVPTFRLGTTGNDLSFLPLLCTHIKTYINHLPKKIESSYNVFPIRTNEIIFSLIWPHLKVRPN
jgi:hypothetical protein